MLRAKYNEYSIFFYNEFTPDVIAMVWRPAAFTPQLFSAMVSEFKRPAMNLWKDDSFVIANTDDLMNEIGIFSKNIISDLKLLDDKKPVDEPVGKRSKKFDPVNQEEESDSDEE